MCARCRSCWSAIGVQHTLLLSEPLPAASPACCSPASRDAARSWTGRPPPTPPCAQTSASTCWTCVGWPHSVPAPLRLLCCAFELPPRSCLAVCLPACCATWLRRPAWAAAGRAAWPGCPVPAKTNGHLHAVYRWSCCYERIGKPACFSQPAGQPPNLLPPALPDDLTAGRAARLCAGGEAVAGPAGFQGARGADEREPLVSRQPAFNVKGCLGCGLARSAGTARGASLCRSLCSCP